MNFSSELSILIASRDERGRDITDRHLLKQFAEAEEKLEELSRERSNDQRPDMSVRAALSTVGWRPDTPAKRVIEYSVLDFEFAEKPKMESLRGFGSRSVDFFVADPRGYGSIFLNMADDFKDKILLNKAVKSVFYNRYGVRVSTADGETYFGSYARSAQACCQVIPSPSHLNFLSGKLKPLTRFHWRTTRKFSLSFPLSSGTAMNSSCMLTVSGGTTQYGWTSRHVTFCQAQPSCT